MHLLEGLAECYQQLKLKVSIDSIEEYREVVFGGKDIEGLGSLTKNFTLSPDDTYEKVQLSSGQVEVITLAVREDFENFLRLMVHKCQNVEISSTIGASILLGVNNWRKIRLHKAEYLKQGGVDWNKEFKQFTSKRENYQDVLIVLCVGNYSNLSYEDTGYSQEEWLRISQDIRKNHELTHFICRKKYPEKAEAVKDEVIADAIGLIMAMRNYSVSLARKILGIAEDGSYMGGRLEEYVSDHTAIERISLEVNQLIHKIALSMQKVKKDDFELEWLVDYLVGCENVEH